MDRPPTKMSPLQISQLASTLKDAIRSGDKSRASTIADLLANERVLINIANIEHPLAEPENPPDEIWLVVQVEDRDNSGPELKIRVRPNISILELKLMFWKNYGFPVEVQRWIMDRRYMDDQQSLAYYGVTVSNSKVFLYLISARSANIKQSREEYHQAQAQVKVASGQARTRPTLAPTFRDQTTQPQPFQPPQDEPIYLPAVEQLPPNIGGPQPPRNNFAPPGHGRALPGSSRPARELFIPPAAMEQVQPPGHGDVFLWQAPGTDKAEAPAPHPMTLPQPTLPPQQMPGAEPPRQPLNNKIREPPVNGWECKECTLINEPTRPGCAACSSPRPADYRVPENPLMSERERSRLEREALQERMAFQGVHDDMNEMNIVGAEGSES